MRQRAAKRTEAMTKARGAGTAIFPDAKTFAAAAENYFTECDLSGRLYGEAGLCLALSRGNPGARPVTLQTLRAWYDGRSCLYLQEVVQLAYLRIQEQIEQDPRYRERGMVTRGIFLNRQPRLGGYHDKGEGKHETLVTLVHGANIDESDFA